MGISRRPKRKPGEKKICPVAAYATALNEGQGPVGAEGRQGRRGAGSGASRDAGDEAGTKQQRVAELEERARLFGDSVKQSARAKVLERKWLSFLLVHGVRTTLIAKNLMQ